MQMLSKKRHIVVMLTIIAMFFTVAIPISSDTVSAETPIVLTVYDGDRIKATYTMADILQIQEDEGDKDYLYSRYNASSTFSNTGVVNGPTIDGILSDAGINLLDNQKISFIAPDGYTKTFTSEQFNVKRYYFPNGSTETENGKGGNETSRSGKISVPMVINTNTSNSVLEGDSKLCLGQVSPNEQNHPAFNNSMLGTVIGGVLVGGKIKVESSKISKVNDDMIFKDEISFYAPGDSIALVSKSNAKSTIYYTLDNTTPTRDSDIYNYKTSGTPKANVDIKAENDVGSYNIRLLLTNYGENDSLVTLIYSIGEIGIYYDDVFKGTVSAIQMKELMDTTKKYNYSGYNTKGNFKRYEDIQGPAIEDIISKAGVTISSIEDYHQIHVSSGDYGFTLTKKQLLSPTRSDFPNGNADTSLGGKGTSNSLNGKKEVPALASMKEGRFYIGQEHPNEQNRPLFADNFVKGGTINVTTDTAPQLDEITISPSVRSLLWGSQVSMTLPQTADQQYTKIYYTLDGSLPSVKSDIYNYNSFPGDEATRNISVLAGTSIFNVKAYAVAYGFRDSTPTAIAYPTIPTATSGVKAAPSNYQSAKISWSKVTGVDGYNIYRSTSANGTYSIVKKVTGQSTISYTDTGLKTGKTYFYKVATYKGSAESAMSASVSAKPVLKKPTSVKATAKGKKKIVITSKKVAGASGYVVYRSTKKSSGFKAIKTIKKSTLKYTDKKVKKGKKYYYKVKAYRIVDGKKVYSPYSARVARKAK